MVPETKNDAAREGQQQISALFRSAPESAIRPLIKEMAPFQNTQIVLERTKSL
jgi:hypothetical protein